MPALPAIDADLPVTARRAGIGMSVLFMAVLRPRKKSKIICEKKLTRRK